MDGASDHPLQGGPGGRWAQPMGGPEPPGPPSPAPNEGVGGGAFRAAPRRCSRSVRLLTSAKAGTGRSGVALVAQGAGPGGGEVRSAKPQPEPGEACLRLGSSPEPPTVGLAGSGAASGGGGGGAGRRRWDQESPSGQSGGRLSEAEEDRAASTKTAVGPFNPGRMNVAGDVFQNGGFTAHHNPDSWISQSASFPRNQKQPGVDSLSPVDSLPKQIFQPSVQQQPTKPAKITCANCKKPLQKGQTAYQRKGSAHLFCSTTCLSSFSHKRTPKKRKVTCKKGAPAKQATLVPQGESSESFQKFCGTSLSPYENNQNLRKRVLNKSRCTICSKLTEIRHEVSVNNVTHKLCSNQCFNKYRLANGLVMNCCEQCGEYLPSKGAGNNLLVIEGQQMRFCCQSCVNEYKQMMETNSKKVLASENRKRNAVREENERELYGSLNILLEKIERIPVKKEKTSELQVSAECSQDTPLVQQDVNLPPSVSTIADKFQEQLEEKQAEDSIIPAVLSADPGTWPRILSIKERDTLVENDPPQVRNFNFPKDSTGRKFSETYYTRILPNGEKTTRSWLLYSTSKDSVFCLYCKLFGEGKNQLKNENGCKDWQHLSHILSKHEESEMHINNSVKYSKLKSDLKKSKTVEHRLQENMGKEGVKLLYTLDLI
ncbi:zinc finger MYM-type protein 5 isoform X2 [Orcinus orca]|uniref:zinc finger MYM-type protein 5 isoform X2 n=1 Tax=Orcinus orca TaxID=9733 RepID=UPI002111CA52|nr:zinc finger MYM-type protein 5 isoform X2 [Orcinus orca]